MVLLGNDDERLVGELRAAQAREEAVAMVDAPAFEEKGTRWYKGQLYERRVLPLYDGCKHAFGPRAVLDYPRGGPAGSRCVFSETRSATEEELTGVRAAVLAHERLPPARRLKAANPWSALERQATTPLDCPARMKPFRTVDLGNAPYCLADTDSGRTPSWSWDECVKPAEIIWTHGCEGSLSERQYCPTGERFGDDGYCVDARCSAGTTPLERASRGRLVGCFSCPIGVLDVEQTLAASGWSPAASARRKVTVLGREDVVLCRVRPDRR